MNGFLWVTLAPSPRLGVDTLGDGSLDDGARRRGHCHGRGVRAGDWRLGRPAQERPLPTHSAKLANAVFRMRLPDAPPWRLDFRDSGTVYLGVGDYSTPAVGDLGQKALLHGPFASATSLNLRMT